ncbi:polyprenyl synthetase family protein [Planctomycetota bacterium]
MREVGHRKFGSMPMRDALIGQPVPRLQSVQTELQAVLAVITEQLRTLPVTADIEALLAFHSQNPGKLMRPGLVLLAGKCCGSLTSEHIQVGAIMEMIHGATLLHDDVIDESNKRRGRMTINSRWSNASAVLLGDFVLTHVLRMCVNLPAMVSRIVADTAGCVCRGELLQTLGQDTRATNEAHYLSIIQDKSAAFFAGCCQAGAALSEASRVQQDALVEYGLQVGMAFQMADDLIDVCGYESLAGKPVGNDVDDHLTLPVIRWLQTLTVQQRDRVDLQDTTTLLAELEKSGSIDYVRAKCQDATQKALNALEAIEESEAKTTLIELATYAGDRSS